jgi:hypothetical protein
VTVPGKMLVYEFKIKIKNKFEKKIKSKNNPILELQYLNLPK